MTTQPVARAPRRAAPALPQGEITLEPPPGIPQPTGARWQQWLSVLPILAGTVATALMFGGREGASSYTYVVGGVFGLSTLGLLVTNWGGAGGPRKAELMRARRDYLRYLAGVRQRARAVEAAQRDAVGHRHPDPAVLWAQVPGRRVWERRVGDADFAVVRVGRGPQALATPLVAPAIEPTADLEPVTAGALRRLLATYSVVDGLPISLALRSFTRVYVVGAGARALVRGVVGQLATFHAPDDLLVAAGTGPAERRDWEWLKWLPHALHPGAVDGAGPVRLIGGSLEPLGDLLAKRPRFRPGGPTPGPHVVLILDGLPPESDVGGVDGVAGLTTVHLGVEPPSTLDRATIVLTAGADGRLTSSTVDGAEELGRADGLSLVEAESLARRLAPLRPADGRPDQAPLATDQDLTELLGLAGVATAPDDGLWPPRSERDHLRIPIGVAPDGSTVELDLKEAAQDGMGPHGLVVGATGSGKSELLRTLVLGLAATHSPEQLNVVLVDFKGGATFASLDRLPHTSAVITNLADALPLVDRMKDAMSGELTRRQELLRRAGNFASVRDYERARAGGAPLAPLPSLLLVCDEFTEMLVAKPDLIELFVQIGRIGRSIGIHLLLATQRLEEGRLRGLETNLSYRIALRTFTAHESRMTLGGASDAAELPAAPGHGYLRVGPDELQRFQAAYVSGPYRGGPATVPGRPHRIVEYSSAPVPLPTTSTVELSGGSLLDLVVDRLAGHGPAAHRVWLPPLGPAPSLDALLGPIEVDPERGLAVADPARAGHLRVPIAIADKPFEQRRDPAVLELGGAAGHVAIVGNPQSGKSQAVRALVLSLALTHTPTEVQLYCLDFGGGSLAPLVGLPHVGGVAGRLDAATVRRTVGEVATLLADRERRFAAHRIDSMATFRRLRRPSELDATLALPEDGYGDVFLVVDGWGTLRHEYEDLEPAVVDIATRGLSYGIHVVASATRWADFRHTVKDLFGSRLELRLGDPGDSAVSRRAAQNVPTDAPGRGLVPAPGQPDGLHVLTVLPQTSALRQGDLIAALAQAWTGPRAPAVRMLPARLPYDALLEPAEDGPPRPVGAGLTLPIGVAETDLRPVLLEFGTEPHLVAFGDSGCGKSTLLRSLAATITRRFTPEQARIVVVDYRRSLLGAIESEHLIGSGTSAENTAPLIASVAGYLARRRPGPDVTPEQLRDRSWWTGPECFVLVDDYELVATGATNPLTPLLEYLSQARDVGLHVILTRRSGGAARALYEPILQRLRELGSPGLVMSGDREEGPLVGPVRPQPLPPGRAHLVTRRHPPRLIQLPLP